MTDSTERPPVYFSSLELENVRCFGQRQSLSLTDDEGNPVRWTLILGDNGVGKTTLLQCLAWMRPLQKINNKGKTTAFVPALNNEENRILDALMRVGPDVNATIKATLSIGRSLGPGRRDTTKAKVTTEFAMQGSDGELKETRLKGTVPKKFRNVLPSALTIFGYGATRRSGTLKLERGGLTDPLASRFDTEIELYDAEDVLLKLDHRARISAATKDKNQLSRIKEILATVLPGIDSAKDISIAGPVVFDDPTEGNGVQFATRTGTVPLSALSLGYQTTLTWITDLALRLYERFPKSSNPLSEPGIVLIDNIELHLHPRWQRHMMEDLSRCFPKLQFVATAHSPLVVQAAEGGNLAVLQEVEGQASIMMHAEPVTEWRTDQILASDLFGIPSRSRWIQELVEERDILWNKENRDSAEVRRLRWLTDKVDRLRTAEDPEDQAAMDLIRKVAAELSEDGSNQS